MLGRIFRIITGTGCPICGGRVKLISADCVLGDTYKCIVCGRKLQEKR